MARSLLSKYNIILAADEGWGIGVKSLTGKYTLPWNLPSDLNFFKKITKNCIVVMGKNTFYSLPEKSRPLPGRVNYILSKNKEVYDDICQNYSSLNANTSISFTSHPLDVLKAGHVLPIYIIGGSQIYDWYLKNVPWLCDKIILTEVTGNESNIFLSNYTKNFIEKLIIGYNSIDLEYHVDSSNYQIYRRRTISNNIRHPEYQYLSLLKNVLSSPLRENRTGINTYSKFGGKDMEFDLTNNQIPLLISKRMPFKTILTELLWFLSGETDTKLLTERGVKIWEKNTSREFLDSTDKHHIPTGDIGEGYGWQWRNFGAKKYTNEKGNGIDQIKNIIHLLKTDPFSRRLIISAWNPASMKDCALPPCHVLFQLYVEKKDDKYYLDGKLYQRSCDLFLGVPFNIASYSILIHILSRLGSTEKIKLHPGRFLYTYGDVHIYENHKDQVLEQLKRQPLMPYPILDISAELNELEDLFKNGLNIELFTLNNYISDSSIKAPMAV